MNNFYKILLRNKVRKYNLPLCKLEIKPGMKLILETNRGLEFGEVVLANSTCNNCQAKKQDIQIKRVIREATQEDLTAVQKLATIEADFLSIAHKYTSALDLAIKVKKCEVLFDQTKSFFYYLLDELNKGKKGKDKLKDFIRLLSKDINSRLELKEINERNLAKVMGDVGSCGRSLCCVAFLDKMKATSIKMAKDQGLAINMLKLSGQCGKLKCCLRYEDENANEERKVGGQ